MLPRFRHILVPTDFTERTRAAMDIAFDIAVQNRAAVTLLHVIESIHSDDADISRFYERLELRAHRELETLAQRFIEANLPIEWKVRIGKRATEIVGFAGSHKVDLIVMSSHRVDSTNVTESFSTLSYQVSICCPCPVLLVK